MQPYTKMKLYETFSPTGGFEKCSPDMAGVYSTSMKSVIEENESAWARLEKTTSFKDLQEAIKNSPFKGLDNDLLYKTFKESIEHNLTSKAGNMYRFPISRFDTRNANNRVYTHELFQRVVESTEAKWRGQAGLMDHPLDDNEASIKNIAIVWHDIELPSRGQDPNNIVWGIGSFVGPFGRLALEVIMNGGRIGFSSSGAGELDRDGVVNPHTYELDRVADLVLNPSQSVYGTSQHLEQVANPKKTHFDMGRQGYYEHTNPSPFAFKPQETKEITMQENKPTVVATQEDAQTARFRVSIRESIEQMTLIVDPIKRIEECDSLAECFSDGVASDLLGEIQKEKELANKQIKEYTEQMLKLQHEILFEKTENVCASVIELKEKDKQAQEFVKTVEEDTHRSVRLKNEETKRVAMLRQDLEEKDREVRKLIRELKDSHKQTRDIESQFKEHKKVSYTQDSKARKVISAKDHQIKALKEAKDNLGFNCDRLDKEVNKTHRQLSRTQKEVKNYQVQLKKVSNQLRELEIRDGVASRGLEEATVKTRIFKSALSKKEEKAKRMTRKAAARSILENRAFSIKINRLQEQHLSEIASILQKLEDNYSN